MSFTPGCPFDGESLGQSKLEVRNNFASLRTTISNTSKPNHIDVNLAGAGKHAFIQMPVQTPGAANLPLALEGGLITQTVSGSSELFYVRDAVVTYTQLTRGNPTIAASGVTFLPGGVRIAWGQANASGGVANFTFAQPFTSEPYSIQVSAEANSPSGNQTVISINTPTNVGFQALTQTSTLLVHYFAIGV